MRTRLPVICCVLAIALAASITHAQDFVWAKQMGGTRFDYGEAVAVDSSGNTYATGIFEGTSTFGSSILNSAGFQDIFVEKLAPDGAVQWAKRMGGGNCRLGSCSCLRCKRESLRNWIFYWYSGL